MIEHLSINLVLQGLFVQCMMQEAKKTAILHYLTKLEVTTRDGNRSSRPARRVTGLVEILRRTSQAG